jgi:hypothetical protein
LTTLPVKFSGYEHHVFLSSQFRNQKSCTIFKRRFLKKGWTITHERYGFSLERDNKPHAKKKVVLFIHRMVSRMYMFLVDELPSTGSLESVAVLGLNAMFREAYSTDMLQVWYPFIDMHFILLHEKFENGLSILIWKNKTTSCKKLQLEIVKFLKKSIVFKCRPPTVFPTRFFSNSCVRCNQSKLGAPGHVKSSSHGDGFSNRFY